MERRFAILAVTAAIVAGSATQAAAARRLAGPAATIRVAPRTLAATPTLFVTDPGFTRRDLVDQSMFGVGFDKPLPIAAGARAYMVLSFFQSHPGRDWRCETFFSFEPREGGAYRVVHDHRFEQYCSATVIDLATGEPAEGYRVEAPLPVR